MSLEAVAALLGHRSMTMTLTCARIAGRTVAREYFAVSQQAEALYDAEPVLPASTEGPNMRRLHTETTRRLPGNGYCTRPAEPGCRYETICETCTFFTTTIEFRRPAPSPANRRATPRRHQPPDRLPENPRHTRRHRNLTPITSISTGCSRRCKRDHLDMAVRGRVSQDGHELKNVTPAACAVRPCGNPAGTVAWCVP